MKEFVSGCGNPKEMLLFVESVWKEGVYVLVFAEREAPVMKYSC